MFKLWVVAYISLLLRLFVICARKTKSVITRSNGDAINMAHYRAMLMRRNARRGYEYTSFIFLMKYARRRYLPNGMRFDAFNELPKIGRDVLIALWHVNVVNLLIPRFNQPPASKLLGRFQMASFSPPLYKLQWIKEKFAHRKSINLIVRSLYIFLYVNAHLLLSCSLARKKYR